MQHDDDQCNSNGLLPIHKQRKKKKLEGGQAKGATDKLEKEVREEKNEKIG